MEKIKYTKVENYQERKKNLLAGFKGVIGTLPSGFDDDLFVSALLKIEEFYKTKFPDTKIPASVIPDEFAFPSRLKEYTISQLIHRRIARNVSEVNFSENFDPNETAMAKYSPSQRNIQIFNNKLKSNIENALSSYKLTDFESEDDFKKMMTEECLVHEILHAISDNGMMLGFFKPNDTTTTSLNEGMTENLALEISGLKNCYSKCVAEINDARFGVRGQTSSGYILENNIANLVRISSEGDLSLPYLVDVKQAKFGALAKIEIYASSSPLKVVADTLSKIPEIREEKNKILDNIENAKKQLAKTTVKEGKEAIEKQIESLQKELDTNKIKQKNAVENIQKLQAILIEDILKNNLQNTIKRDFNKNSHPTQKDYDRLLEDLMVIGSSIIPTLPDKEAQKQIVEKDMAEKGYIEKIEFLVSPDLIRQQIKDGKIQQTENVERYLQYLGAVKEIGRDFNLDFNVTPNNPEQHPKQK